jgi:hypothetical protein
MPLQPSRRDVLGPPPRDVTDLATVVRHQGSYLRSLDPGILDGTRATPRPVGTGPTELVGGDLGGGEAAPESILWEDGDRLVLTSLATQVWRLSHVPFAESLVILWHPDGGAGVPWLREEYFDLSEDDGVVTITADQLTSGKAAINDVFSAHYPYVDGADEAPTPPATVALRDTSSADGSNSPFTNYALPAGTVLGDLIVIAANGITFTDPRFTPLGLGMLIGFATDLTTVLCSAPAGIGAHWGITVTAYETNAVGWTGLTSFHATSLASGDPISIPTVSDVSAAVVTIWDSHVIVAGYTSLPTGWASGTGAVGSSLINTRCDYWDNASELGTSPTGPTTYTGGSSGGTAGVTVVGLIGPEV